MFVIVRDDGDEALAQAKEAVKPGLRCGDWLTNLATGFWLSVMMASSPGANWLITSLSLALGSIRWLIVVMTHLPTVIAPSINLTCQFEIERISFTTSS